METRGQRRVRHTFRGGGGSLLATFLTRYPRHCRPVGAGLAPGPVRGPDLGRRAGNHLMASSVEECLSHARCKVSMMKLYCPRCPTEDWSSSEKRMEK